VASVTFEGQTASVHSAPGKEKTPITFRWPGSLLLHTRALVSGGRRCRRFSAS